MLIKEDNKLSYIKHLMFRQEFKNMMNRDFTLNKDTPYCYDATIVSEDKPPVISTEITETYTYYPVDSDPFKINIRNLMIEQEALNRIRVISDIYFPKNFAWPVITDEEEQRMKKMDCFTGGTPSKWNLAAIDGKNHYQFTDTYYLAYRDGFEGKKPEIVQFSDFDPNRVVEYFVKSSESFEVNLDHCDEAKWRSNTKPQYSLKKDKNGIYQLF